MNKRHLSIISLLFVVSILVAGCSPAEDKSPSTRLVGHWEAPYVGEDLPREIYLGELSTDGKGKLYMTEDLVNFCERTYEILSENIDTYTVRFYREYTTNHEDYSIELKDEGFNIALELINEIKGIKGVHGIHITALFWEDIIPSLVKKSGFLPRP